MKKVNFKKKMVVLFAVCALVTSSVFVTDENRDYNDGNGDGHEWVWHDDWHNSGFAYDSNGNAIDHHFCRGCGRDLTVIANDKSWEKDDLGKGQQYWINIYNNSHIGCAQTWHELKYGCNISNTEYRSYNVDFTIPGWWECKKCGQRKAADGGWCSAVSMGEDAYDINGNYIGECGFKEYCINIYCFQNNVTPKYYSHYDTKCKYASGDDPVDPVDPVDPSDPNGNGNNGGESTGQDDNGPAGGDTSGRKGGFFKNEYVNGVWYGSDGKADPVYNKGHWRSDASGYWFEDNGYYPTSSWLKIDGKYYYFCADGYMDYSEYREGCWLNADGSWNESYSGGHWNEWSPGSGWWWYTDNTGYYPNGGSCWIDGHQYQFDADGWTYSK